MGRAAGYPPRVRRTTGSLHPPDMIPLIYHPKYNITVFGLERLHPFDGLKYRRIHDALIADGSEEAGRLPPPAADRPRGSGARPHAGIPALAPAARRCWRRSSTCRCWPGSRRVFIDWRVLSPMRYAAGGTLAGLPHGARARHGDQPRRRLSPCGRPRGAMASASTPTSRIAAATLHAEGSRARPRGRPRRPPGQRHRARPSVPGPGPRSSTSSRMTCSRSPSSPRTSRSRSRPG